jgi:hypothetical protein
LVASSEEEAIFEARPPAKPVLVLIGLGLIPTLAMFACAFAFQSKIALVVALCLTCGDAFIAVFAVTALRSSYRVRLDFRNRQISVADRKGLSESLQWTGDFLQIEAVALTRDGLRLTWENGEPGPTLVMPRDEAERICQRLANR